MAAFAEVLNHFNTPVPFIAFERSPATPVRGAAIVTAEVVSLMYLKTHPWCDVVGATLKWSMIAWIVELEFISACVSVNARDVVVGYL